MGKYLIHATKQDDLTTLKEELDFFKTYFSEDLNLNCAVSFKNKERLLHIAAKHGSKKVFSYLLKQGVDINKTDIHGNTAGHYAVIHRQPRILKLLKENDADFLLKNKCGKTLKQYIQTRPIKEKNKRIKIELENIISQITPSEVLANKDTPALGALIEIAKKYDQNFLKVEDVKKKEIYLNKIQEINALFFHNVSGDSQKIQTEPLNLIKQEKPLDLSITPCFK